MRRTDDLRKCAEIYDLEALRAFDLECEFIYDDFGNVSFLSELVQAGRVSPPDASKGASGVDVCGVPAHIDTDAPAIRGGVTGSPFTNRGVTKRTSCVCGGFDGGCEAGFYGSWDVHLQSLLFERLERAKTARAGGNASLAYVVFGRHLWKVAELGARVGGLFYAYVLECHGVKLYIHTNPQGDIPPVRVRFGACCLYYCNLFSAVRYLRRVLVAVGFVPDREVVSRVDCQVTLAGVTVAEFYNDMSRPGCLVTRATGGCDVRNNLKTGAVETVTLASNSIELCIYDKYAQMLTLSDSDYRAFVWGGLRSPDIPRDLARVELRFRREALRRYGISTFADLQESVASLIAVTLSDWVRVLDRPATSGNTRRYRVSPLWAEIQGAFLGVFSEKKLLLKPLVRRVRVPSRSVDHLLPIACGFLARMASIQLPLVEGIDDIYDFFDAFFREHGEKIFERCRSMQLEAAVSDGFTAGSLDVSDSVADEMGRE